MNWEAIGAVGEVLGALAVVLTLLYLAAQIRASRVALRATQRESALESVRQWNHQIMSDQQLADIIRRGTKDYDDLDSTERVRFGHCFYSFFKAYEDIYLREDAGDVWAGHEPACLLYANQPGVLAWLRRSESLIDPRFFEAMRSGGGVEGDPDHEAGRRPPSS